MSSARFNEASGTRERTQLFANARPYQPAQAMNRASPVPNMVPSPSPGPSYSDAVLSQLESQNDEHFEGLSSKVRLIKEISLRIGDEVRQSSTVLGGLEERFDSARSSVKSTVTRLVRTADKSGVSWRSWLGLFGIIAFCFWLVLWL